ESIVEIAAAIMPIMTTRAKAAGTIGIARSVGVAISAFSRPGTSSLAANPHNTDIKV
ncbi:unnamed protein product, partial [marine sediment metagenome]